MVGRASDQPVGCVCDRLHCPHAAREIVTGSASQPRQAVALAVLLEREQIALLRVGLELVEAGDGLRAVAERRMARHVVDALGADIDRAAVAHALELFFSVDQHCGSVGLRILV